MRSIRLLSLLVACVGLAACDQTVTVQNGQIPAQYLLTAKNIVGTYGGSADGIQNALTISLNGDQASLSSATDLFGGECRARLGELLSFTYNSDNGNPVITGASFALDPGYCAGRILATQVDLSFNGTRNFSLSFLNHVEFQNHCYYAEAAVAARDVGFDRPGVPPVGGHDGDHDGDHGGDHGGGWHGNPIPYPPVPHCYTEAVNVYTYGNFSR